MMPNNIFKAMMTVAMLSQSDIAYSMDCAGKGTYQECASNCQGACSHDPNGGCRVKCVADHCTDCVDYNQDTRFGLDCAGKKTSQECANHCHTACHGDKGCLQQCAKDHCTDCLDYTSDTKLVFDCGAKNTYQECAADCTGSCSHNSDDLGCRLSCVNEHCKDCNDYDVDPSVKFDCGGRATTDECRVACSRSTEALVELTPRQIFGCMQAHCLTCPDSTDDLRKRINESDINLIP